MPAAWYGQAATAALAKYQSWRPYRCRSRYLDRYGPVQPAPTRRQSAALFLPQDRPGLCRTGWRRKELARSAYPVDRPSPRDNDRGDGRCNDDGRDWNDGEELARTSRPELSSRPPGERRWNRWDSDDDGRGNDGKETATAAHETGSLILVAESWRLDDRNDREKIAGAPLPRLRPLVLISEPRNNFRCSGRLDCDRNGEEDAFAASEVAPATRHALPLSA